MSEPAAHTFTTTLWKPNDQDTCAVKLPFDPKDVFGKVRAPVRVTIGGHEFRTTIASMGGCFLFPVNKVNRQAAGVDAGDTVEVHLVHDAEPRRVEVPDDLQRALRRGGVLRAWKKLSYSHQREHVSAITEAKRPETRERRIAKAIDALRASR